MFTCQVNCCSKLLKDLYKHLYKDQYVFKQTATHET